MAYLQMWLWVKMKVLGWIMCSIEHNSIYLLKNDAYLFDGMIISKATSKGRLQVAAFVHKIL